MADGRTRFADLHELRIKESDRIASLARELGRAGRPVAEAPDGFEVEGSPAPVRGGVVRPDHDHRIAMAGAVLGLCAEPGEETTLPAVDIGTSFPTFAETLRGLGAEL